MASFTHVQGAVGSAGAASLTVSVNLAAAPTVGNLVCVGINIGSASSNVVVKDGNGNVYTASTPNGTGFISPNSVYLYYLRTAPANASATITVTWTNSAAAEIWADEFSYTSGFTCKFDKDFVSNNSGSPGTSINTPSVTPTNSGSLVYVIEGAHGTTSAPAAGATLGSWTGAGGAITNGHMAEYALSISGATAVQFTQGSATWTCLAAAFYLVVNAHIQLESGTGNVALEGSSGAIALE
jgi:hypothetical protein